MNTNSVSQSSNSSLSFFNKISKNVKTNFESAAHFFSSKKNPAQEENGISITERKEYYRLDYDEIVQLILKYAPFKDRLLSLPLVSYQFYNLSQDFSARCHKLHHLIPKLREVIRIPSSYTQGASVSFGLNFHEAQKNSLNLREEKIYLYQITFPYEEVSYELFKSTVESCYELLQGGIFDLTVFNQQLRNKAETDSKSEVTEFYISRDEFRQIKNLRYDSQSEFKRKTIEDALNFDEETFEKIAEVLRGASQIFLKDSFDLIDLKNKLMNCFKDEERKKIIGLIEMLEEQSHSKFDQGLEEIMNSSYKLADIKRKNVSRVSEFASLSHPQQIQKMKETREHYLDKINLKIESKQCMFLIEKKGKEFSTIQSKYSSQLISPNSELDDEHRWFAERIIADLIVKDKKTKIKKMISNWK